MNTAPKNERRETGNPTTPVAEEVSVTPYVDIHETKDGYQIEAEMPGVNKKGLEILLEGNELIILGRREWETGNAEVYYRESRPRNFRRVFELDPAIDAGKIAARVENGVLSLQLPKTEQVKPKRIPVSG